MIAVEEADEDKKSRIDAGKDGRLYTFFLPLLCLPNASSTSLIYFDLHHVLDRARPTVCREKEQEPITISLTLHNERDR